MNPPGFRATTNGEIGIFGRMQKFAQAIQGTLFTDRWRLGIGQLWPVHSVDAGRVASQREIASFNDASSEVDVG